MKSFNLVPKPILRSWMPRISTRRGVLTVMRELRRRPKRPPMMQKLMKLVQWGRMETNMATRNIV